MHKVHQIAGYSRCKDCGTIVNAVFARQTKGRCVDCWKDQSPLETLEVINKSVRFSARVIARNDIRKHPSRVGRRLTPLDRINEKARIAALKRLSHIFPDLYAMMLDEERVIRGMPPIAHFEPLDFEKVSSKTLGFERVYDALESRGVSDA